MYEKGTTIKARIISTANNLFYHQGFNQTSFTDIANSAQIPKGNFYHYFKSKEAILESVLEQRLISIKNHLQSISEKSSQPITRIKLFIRSLENNKNGFKKYGCPTGSLNSELGKTQIELQNKSWKILEAVRLWLASQLKQSGIQSKEAHKLSRHMLARIQGAILLTHTYHNEEYFLEELKELINWLETCRT